MLGLGVLLCPGVRGRGIHDNTLDPVPSIRSKTGGSAERADGDSTGTANKRPSGRLEPRRPGLGEAVVSFSLKRSASIAVDRGRPVTWYIVPPAS